MRIPIDFNDQLYLETYKINDIDANSMLPAEF